MTENKIKLVSRNNLLFCFVFLCCFSTIYSQKTNDSTILFQANNELQNGNYTKATALASIVQTEAKKSRNNVLVSKSLNIIASSQISQRKYKEAENYLNQSLEVLSDKQSDTFQKAATYIHFAQLYRFLYKFQKSLEFSKKAVSLAPEAEQVLGEHYLNTGRIFYNSGYDISAIIWLEKAEKLFKNKGITEAKLETLRFLSLAWQAKSNYTVALKYAETLVAISEKTAFKEHYRQSLLDLATIFSAIGQKTKSYNLLKKGEEISVKQGNSLYQCLFLNSLLSNSLYEGELKNAATFLQRLEVADKSNDFSFEIALAKAELASYNYENEVSENLFKMLEISGNQQIFPVLYRKIRIAQKLKDWDKVISLNTRLMDITLEGNFKEDLPNIFLTFAKAYFKLRQNNLSLNYLEKCLALIEEIRKSNNAQISLNLFEIYHDAYRLLSELNIDQPEKAFETTELLKSRFLKDKINNSLLDNNLSIPKEIKLEIEKLSLKFIEEPQVESELRKYEHFVTNKKPESNSEAVKLDDLNKLPELENTAIVSYLFTLDRKLLAFVWQKGLPVKTFHLSIDEDETNLIAKDLTKKIKNFIFFKQDSKKLFDLLLKPLDIQAKHLILVPDKSLWKIPFQALSADGKTYLIENQLITYAPSVSILLSQLKTPSPQRKTFQVFSNSLFNNLYLKYADTEANNLAQLFGTKANLNSTVKIFEEMANKSDIIHFSMHAEADYEEAFNSFLAFRSTAKDNGRLTVGDLLKLKLKKGSMGFIASCDTNNVFNGEGLVSLAWGIMGAGSSTVISAQWQANDEATAQFTQTFYKYYKSGISSSEALQKASIDMINSPDNAMNEPYHWAVFTLNGDYR